MNKKKLFCIQFFFVILGLARGSILGVMTKKKDEDGSPIGVGDDKLGKVILSTLLMAMGLWSVAHAKPKKVKSAPVVIEEDNDVKDLSSRVQKEIKRQMHEQTRQEQKQRLYQPARRKGEEGGYLVYKVPALPFHVTSYEQRDLLQLTGIFENANEAYTSRGTACNLSKLLFGEQPITIQDILLVSKLLRENKIDLNDNYKETYLYNVAMQPIYFSASLQRYEVLFGYARHFFKGEVSFGLQLPVVMLHNTLKLGYNVIPDTKNALNNKQVDGATALDAAGVFPAQYHSDFGEFVADVFTQKGIDFNQRNTTVGFGDALAFINCELKSLFFDRGMLGASLRVPTAKQRDTGKLWDPEKGNGGFVQTSAFASMLWATHRFFNPYVYAQGTYSFPVSLDRRVPKYWKAKLTDGQSIVIQAAGGPANPPIIFSSNLNANNAQNYINDKPPYLDTTIRGFADGITKVTINRGIEVAVKVGNIIERVFFARGFLDMHAQLRVKARDYIGGRRHDDEYDTSVLTQNTSEVEATLGAQFNYQHDENFRSWLGGRFVITGSNVPRTLGIEAGMNVEF
jgi:hypothetical protein